MTLTIIGIALLAHPAQATETITFDTVNNAPSYFGGVSPGGSSGPTVTDPGVNIMGGVILNDSNFHNEADTQPNLYVTSDTAILFGGTMLPGIVTGTFGSPGLFSSIALYVANGGNDTSTFALTAYNSNNAVIGSNSVSLSSQNNGALSVGRATFTGPNIDYFTVTLTSPSAAPEPSQAGMMALIALSLGGLLLRARRNKARLSPPFQVRDCPDREQRYQRRHQHPFSTATQSRGVDSEDTWPLGLGTCHSHANHNGSWHGPPSGTLSNVSTKPRHKSEASGRAGAEQ